MVEAEAEAGSLEGDVVEAEEVALQVRQQLILSQIHADSNNNPTVVVKVAEEEAGGVAEVEVEVEVLAGAVEVEGKLLPLSPMPARPHRKKGATMTPRLMKAR